MGILLAVTPGAMAQTINWVGTSSTDWNTAANWDADVVPGAANDVVLDTNTGNQAVFSSENETIGNLTVGNINGGANTALSITDGANLTAASLTIGAQNGSNGTVSISGANSTLVVSNLTVGNLGIGNLVVGSGANVTALGGTILGANSTITQTGGLVNMTGAINGTVGLSGETFNFIGGPLIFGTYNLPSGVLESTYGLGGSGTLILGGGTIQFNEPPAIYGMDATLVANTTTILNLNNNPYEQAAVLEPIYEPPLTVWEATISGEGDLEITGNGLLSLPTENTYTGNTTINGGRLEVSGSLDNSNITINGGGTLMGGGYVGGTVKVNPGGNIMPGASDNFSSSASGVFESEALTVAALTSGTGALTSFYLKDTGNYTQLAVSDAWTISGNLVLNLDNSLYAGIYNLYTTDSQTGDFANVSVAGSYSGALTENNGVWNGTFSGVNITFTTATGVATVSVNLPAGISAAKATWLEDHFSIVQLQDPSISGDSATPAGDGVTNLIKYAFGLDPFSNAYIENATDDVLPQPVVSNGNLELSFFEFQSDLTYTVEASTDLVNWSTNGVTVQVFRRNIFATYPLPETGSAFMRVVVAPGP